MNGFSYPINICKDDPFLLYRYLLSIAPNNVIDLSRGDPYNAPSTRADWVYLFLESFALFLQEQVGDEDVSVVATSQHVDKAWRRAKRAFCPSEEIDQMIDDAEEVVIRLEEISREIGFNWSRYDILKKLGRSIRGAGYGEPAGHPLVRAVVADYLNAFLSKRGGASLDISYQDIILTLGASEAIGQIFEILEFIGFLKPGDVVASLSPVYGPYDRILTKIQTRVVGLNCRRESGFEPTSEDFEAFVRQAEGAKVMIVVNPSNPTGHAYSKELLQRLADFLRDNQTIIIEDVVYFEFVTNDYPFYCLAEMLPAQTLLVGSMSKFHQTTGSRFGYVMISDTANKWLSQKLLDELQAHYADPLHPTIDFRSAFTRAKAPDLYGVFAHTHTLPQPTQWLGAVRLLLGIEDAISFDLELEERWTVFYRSLGIAPPDEVCKDLDLWPSFACYYCLIDFLDLVEIYTTKDPIYASLARAMRSNLLSPEVFFEGLARAGVVPLPAARFYLDDPCQHRWSARFSVANQPLRQVTEAVNRILGYLKRLAGEFQGGLKGH